MNYQLKEKSNGEIDFIAAAGSDFVKSSMPIGRAKGIIESGKAEMSDKFEGFEISVNGEYYFAGSMTAEKKSADEEEKPTKKTTSKKK